MVGKQLSVVLPDKWVAKIDDWAKKNPMCNRQDFIRNAVRKELGE